MDIPKKLIIDIEDKDNAIGYFYTSEDGEKSEAVLAGKRVIPVPENERSCEIYKLLGENCDVIFCTTQIRDDFRFYPVPQFSIFAVDTKGNCFGTIGGIGDIKDDNYPVGYVNRNGMFGKITDSFKEFLELVAYYPHWQEVIRCEQMGESYDLKAMEIGERENNSQYLARQREIQEILKISKNPKSIELLIANIQGKKEFLVYSSKEEAQKTNTFLDICSFD